MKLEQIFFEVIANYDIRIRQSIKITPITSNEKRAYMLLIVTVLAVARNSEKLS